MIRDGDLENIAQIERLMARYWLANDRCDREMLRACFTSNARMYSGGTLAIPSSLESGAKIAARLTPDARDARTSTDPPIPGSGGLHLTDIKARTHFMGQCHVAISGDTACVEAYAVAHVLPTGPRDARADTAARPA